MNTKTQMIVLWGAFWLSAILTWVIYSGGWMMASYHVALSVLAIISACLAFWILKTNPFAWSSVALIVLGLVVGQWWLVEWLIVKILWSIRGFVP